MENLLKSWQTTVVGLLIVGLAVYQIVFLKESVDVKHFVELLMAIGFLKAKDSGDSHTKR